MMNRSRIARIAGVMRSDLIVAATVLAVAGLAVLPILGVGRGTMPLEVRNILAEEVFSSAGRIQGGFSGCRKLYGREDGAPLMALVDLSTAPDPMAGSLLPVIRGAAIPRSLGDAAPADVGNSLFFLSAEAPLDLGGILDGGGVQRDIRAGLLVFHYDYLAQRPGETIGGAPARDLWEWRSVPFSDYVALSGMDDVTLRNNIVAALVARGCDRAFDAASPSPATAFYLLSAASPWISPWPSPRIVGGGVSDLSGSAGDGVPGAFIFSVSPNTGEGFVHQHPVPSRAVPSGDFPSGFETAVSGPSVFVRLVMAAGGHFKGYGSAEQSFSITTAGEGK